MKKFLALAACALLFSPLARAQYILTIDLTDISNVVITATGENATANDSNIDGSAGFTILSFFTSSSDFFASQPSTLIAGGMTFAYAGASANNYDAGAGYGSGVDLSILFGTGTQIFSTSSPAFSGSIALDLTSMSALLPAIGTTGNVRVGDGLILIPDPVNDPDGDPVGVGPVIGQYRVVPEPSTALLVTAAGVAFFGARRRR